MRAVVQRVSSASVTIEGKVCSRIGRGLLVYLGIHRDDTEQESDWTIKKIAQTRIFENGEGKLSLSVSDVQGEILMVSQITLYGDLVKGNRPDMSHNMKPPEAAEFFECFVSKMKSIPGLSVQKGQFGARMLIQSENVGPVTLMIESPPKKV